MAFLEIPGNARIKNILAKALQRQKLPNSLLFTGPAGVGKHSTALVVAKALNCLQKTDDACETCSSCLGINKGNFPDVMQPEPNIRELKIEQMRSLKEAAYLKPMIGKRRVFIVNEAERMTLKAANSLLKVLEEPPLFSHIILITSNPYMILSTIKSRCRSLNFSAVARKEIETCLIEKGLDKTKAETLALLVRGNLKQALSLDWENIQVQRKEAWQLFSALLRGEGGADFLKENSNRQRKYFQEKIEPMLEILASLCRDVLLLQGKGDPALLMNPDYKEKLAIIAGSTAADRITACLSAIDNSLDGFKRNVNLKLMLSSFLINFQEENYV